MSAEIDEPWIEAARQVMLQRGRAQMSAEIRARRMTTLASYSQHTEHPTIFRYQDGKRRCCPVMHWSINDLAAYIATNQIPMLNIYRKFGLTQRTTARVTKKMLYNQGMAICRATNSRGFREFTNLFPETNVQ